MIYSMTAFARVQDQALGGNLTCEIRSINHRYLEMSVHLPEALRVYEMAIRERVRQQIKRGKVEVTLRYQAGHGGNHATVTVNTALASELAKASETVAALLKQPAMISPTDILRMPGVLVSQEADAQQLQETLMHLTDKAIAELVAMRGREGEELKRLFLERADALMTELAKIRERLPNVLAETRERLLKRFEEIKLELDTGRLEQEMLMFAQRIDVAEEIDRTTTHIAEVRRSLQQGGTIGRRLDFLLQELNREANTIGSKSSDSVLTHAAVEMKVLIEQIREQVQNVE